MDEVEQCLILGPVFLGICAMVKSRYIGDKLIPPLLTESL